ncbi:peroxisomal biogenesis factor 19-like isoform X1 [Asterias rubens]|uniref:peroxisomal biogenesis factor 19-like isoform X1 n=2 Tax=Asterias rubens TaxID=7604 RepID=UPI0014553DDA|nr:peroxisomal biogenesis factor 19-like isoform X1 [Asterias rubens]
MITKQTNLVETCKMADRGEEKTAVSSSTLPDKSDQDATVDVQTQSKDDGLDDLLDSALQDFDKKKPQDVPDEKLPEKKTTTPTQVSDKQPPPLPVDQEALFNQLFASEGGAANLESLMSTVMSEFGQDLPQDSKLNDDLAKLLQGGGAEGFPMFGAGPPSGGAPSTASGPLGGALGETITRLAQSAQDLKEGNVPEEEIFKQLENMHLGDGAEGEMMPMMQQMMQNLLSKDILYPSLKEVVEKYPDWLEQNKTKVEQSDFDRFTKQYGLMTRLCLEYESENQTDAQEVRQERMTRIMDLIQEMEGLGQPPKDIVGEGGAGLGLQFDAQGMPKIPGMPQGDQCSVM